MAYERPSWLIEHNVDHGAAQPALTTVQVDTGAFIRTRDALTSACLHLSGSIDRAVKAYLDHTQAVLNGDSSLNISSLLQPFTELATHAQLAQMALQQGVNATGLAPQPNGAIGELDGEKKRKKRNYKQRDPNAPKRPLTAYFRFLGENRPLIQTEVQEHPERFESSGKPGDISKIATDRWKSLTWEEQEPYRKAYQHALKDYEKRSADYKNQGVNTGTKEGESGAATARAVSGEADEQTDSDESESESESDSDSGPDSEEEEVEVTPPPPPPVSKKAPKSAIKKTQQNVVASPLYGSTNKGTPAAAAPAQSAKASPPEHDRKRKASAAEPDGSKKKRNRKSNADSAQATASSPAPAQTVPVMSTPGVASTGEPSTGKKKKAKKEKTKSGNV